MLKMFAFAVFVGVLMIPLVYLAAIPAKLLVGKPALPEICSKWNEHYIMEVNVFISGFMLGLILRAWNTSR